MRRVSSLGGRLLGKGRRPLGIVYSCAHLCLNARPVPGYQSYMLKESCRDIRLLLSAHHVLVNVCGLYRFEQIKST